MDDAMSDAVVDARAEQAQEEREQAVINEEYKIWKKNSVFLYDLLYGQALDWPTLTTQWLPYKKHVEGTESSTHRLLIGTHTSGPVQNYLQFVDVDIPDMPSPDLAELDAQRGEVGGYGAAKKKFEWKITQRINHPTEVNKARYMPQKPDVIASMCGQTGQVLIFDRSKHDLQPPADGTVKFEAELVGHDKEGFGLSWAPRREGQLVTGTEDTTVRTWDLRGEFDGKGSRIKPHNTYNVHSATVNDVQFHPIRDDLIGSASDDLSWKIVDTRVASTKTAVFKNDNAHTDAVQCIAFHPEFESLMATGSADKTVAIWDLRNTSGKVHSLAGHHDQVMGLQWHKHDAAILASSGNDRRICMWDLSKNGAEQTPEEAEDGPPELLFMHGGFTSRICDFDWNGNTEDSWVMLAAAEDNQIQIFRPARSLVEPIKKNANHGEVSD